MKNQLLLIFLTFSFVSVYAQQEKEIRIKNHNIHPERFTSLSNEIIQKDSIQTKRAYKSINDEFYCIRTHNKKNNTNLIEIYNNRGKTKNSLIIKNLNGYAIQNCLISPNGELLHITSILPFYEEFGYKIQTYKDGVLISEIDSVLNFRFNIDQNIISYFKSIEKGNLHYLNFLSKEKWNKQISNEIIYSERMSNNGEIILVRSKDKYYALNSKGDFLWEKEKSFFNGHISLSSQGKYITEESSKSVNVYLIENLDLKWSKNHSEITHNQTRANGIECIDEQKIILVSSKKHIKVFDFEGNLLKSHPYNTNQYFKAYQVDNRINIIVDGKRLYQNNHKNIKR